MFGAIDQEALMNSLKIMGQGMGGIFVVLIIISLIVTLLTKITNKKEKKQ